MTSGKIIHGDALDVMRGMKAGSVDAVVTDPPYPEINRPYGRLTERQWHRLMRAVVRETRRVLKPKGSAVFILQPNFESPGRMRPWLWEFMAWAARDWNLVQDAWWWNPAALPTMAASQHGLLRQSVKACVWLGAPDCARDQDAVLWQQSDSMAAVSREDRALHRLRYHPSGNHVNVGRIAEAVDRRGGVTPFNLLPVSNTNSVSSGGAHGHGAATPLPLCEWWVKYISPPGGLVVDMFAGSGTVGLAAAKHGRRFLGIEKEAEYAETARRRLRTPGPAVTVTPPKLAALRPPMEAR